MIKCVARLAFAVILGFTLARAANAQTSCVPNCELFFEEAYSNANGSVQFLVFIAGGGYGGAAQLAGRTLVARSGSTEHTFVFPVDLPNAVGHTILVGTQGFSDLHLVQPDFIVPNGFLFVRNGTIDIRPGSWSLGALSYDELPMDGVSSLQMSCDDSGLYCSLVPFLAWAANSSDERYDFSVAGSITPAFTGNWYDPAQSGHGLFMEVLPNNRLLAGWFAFDPAGTQQAWFVGVGTYTGNTATITDVEMPTGGRWIPNFDPNNIVRNTWGTLTFTFTDCDHGRVDFNSPLGYGAGSMNLTRLTMPAGLTCP